MSNNKAKLKKQRKPMSPQAKRNLANSFKSILSNQACVDGGKEAPWWIAVIFLVLGVCLPVLPIITNLSKAYGSSFVSAYNMGSDRGLYKTSLTYKADGYDFLLKDDNLLHFYQGEKEINDEDFAKEGGSFVKNDIYIDAANSKEYYNFRLFITYLEGEDLQKFVNSLTDAKFVKGTTNVFVGEVTDDNKDTIYTPSFMVLSRKTLVMATYKNQSTEKYGNTASGLTWDKTARGSLLDRVLETKEDSKTEPQKIDDVFSNWKGVLNEVYLKAKVDQMLKTTFLYLGVYVGLVGFLGLMIFLLTRGKNNQFRYLNPWVTQKIAWWACFTPGVLGMILGFILKGNMIGQMGFIVLVSLRVMWLSMRQLRPM